MFEAPFHSIRRRCKLHPRSKVQPTCGHHVFTVEGHQAKGLKITRDRFVLNRCLKAGITRRIPAKKLFQGCDI